MLFANRRHSRSTGHFEAVLYVEQLAAWFNREYPNMKITLNQNLHAMMKELSRRKKKQTGMTIGGFYAEALGRYVEQQKVPKKVERIIRKQFRFDVPPEMEAFIQACIVIARKRRVALPVVIEEALEQYLAIPDNHLGERFYRGIKKEYYEQ